MAKRRNANPFLGRWLIEEMEQWDVGDEYDEFQPFIELERSNTGQIQFGCVYGEMNCELTQRDGRPAVEFTWDGNDESEHVFGRGWVVVNGDQLNGMIFFHLGDASGFTARSAGKKTGRKGR
jgi:hypothetical protein